MVTAFKFDSAISSAVFDGYRSLTRIGSGASGNGIFSIGKDTAWNSFNDATAVFTTTNLTIGSLGGLLKATAGVVGIASSGTDYEPPVTKGNLTESGSSIITFGGNTSNNVIGAGTTISIHKASAAQDGYLGKDDFAIFSASTHSPVTLNASAITGGLSLNTQEISFRAADTTYDGYLKSSDWATFNGKIGGAGTVADHSIVRFNGTSGNAVHGSTSYITDDGYIGINTSNPEGQLHILSDIFTVANLETSSNSETSFLKFNRSRGTSSSKENVQAGDILGGIWSYGWGGSFYAPTAGIDFIAESNASGGWVPGAIKFWIASVEGDEVARITKDGYMLIGTTDDDGTPAVGRLIVQGYSSDSTTNIFVGRSSSGANVSTLDSAGKWTMANATIGSLGGLLKATAGVVGVASSGTDYEPPVAKTNLTETSSSILTISNGNGSVIGPAPVTIAVQKASAAQDGYLGKDNWATFNGKLTSPMTTNGDLIARIGGVADRLGIGSTGQVLTVAAGLPAWADPAAGTQITQGDTKVYVKDTGSDGYMAVVTDGTEKMRVTPAGYVGIGVTEPSSALDVAGSVEVTSTEWFYIGSPTADGSWRIGLETGDFVVQKRIIGAWITKGTFA